MRERWYLYRRATSRFWWIAVRMPDGSRERFSSGTADEQAARLKAIRAADDIEAGRWCPETREKLLHGPALERLYEEHWKHQKDADRQWYRVAGLIREVGTKPVPLSDAEVTGLVNAWRAAGTAIGTINRRLSVLSMLYKQARRAWGVQLVLPYIPHYREPRGRIRVIQPHEEAQIVRALGAYPDVLDVFLVALDTGMRLSEILRIAAPDVDWEAGMIRIWEAKGEIGSVPMSQRVRDILTRRFGVYGARPFVPLNKDKVCRRMRAACDRLGLPDVSMHVARHTIATRLVVSGASIRTVQAFLRHSTVTQTERYTHLAPQHLAPLLSIVDAQAAFSVPAVPSSVSEGSRLVDVAGWGMVRTGRVELPRVAPPEPKSGANLPEAPRDDVGVPGGNEKPTP